MDSKRAILYARVSRDDRPHEGRNLDGQLDMCRQYAVQNGWVIVAEMAEDEGGASGADLALPELNKILALAQCGAFDLLVVREIDRLARSLPKQLLVESMLAKAGVRIEYVLGDYPDTADGNFLKNIRAAVAELERLKTVERTTRGRLLAVQDGNVLVGDRPPYGYERSRIDGKLTLRIHEEQANIVRLIFEWYTVGDEDGKLLTLTEIAHRLTAMGVPTYWDARRSDPAQPGKPLSHWNPSSVQNMLSKTAYIGQWKYGKSRNVDGRNIPRPADEHISVQIPAIVDEASWRAAQARLDLNLKPPPHIRNRLYLLTGYISCGLCHRSMFGMSMVKRGKVVTYYYCAGKQHRVRHLRNCPTPYYRVVPIDEAVWAWLKSLLTNPEQLETEFRAQQSSWTQQVAPLREQLDRISKQIGEQQAQQKRLLDLYLEDKLAASTWEERNDELHAKLRLLTQDYTRQKAHLDQGQMSEEQLQRLHAFARQTAAQLDEADASYEAKRRLLEMLDLHVMLHTDADGNRFAQVSCSFGPAHAKIDAVALAARIPVQKR